MLQLSGTRSGGYLLATTCQGVRCYWEAERKVEHDAGIFVRSHKASFFLFVLGTRFALIRSFTIYSSTRYLVSGIYLNDSNLGPCSKKNEIAVSFSYCNHASLCFSILKTMAQKSVFVFKKCVEYYRHTTCRNMSNFGHK